MIQVGYKAAVVASAVLLMGATIAQAQVGGVTATRGGRGATAERGGRAAETAVTATTAARAATSAARAQLAGRLNAYGVTSATALNSLTAAQEAGKTADVERIMAVLGSDSSQRAQVKELLENGTSVSQIANSLTASARFTADDFLGEKGEKILKGEEGEAKANLVKIVTPAVAAAQAAHNRQEAVRLFVGEFSKQTHTVVQRDACLFANVVNENGRNRPGMCNGADCEGCQLTEDDVANEIISQNRCLN